MEYNLIQAALDKFTKKYSELWQSLYQCLPKSDKELYDTISPCVVNLDDDDIFWQPVSMEPKLSLIAVEKCLNITIHLDAHAFYCVQYSGDMQAKFNDIQLTLIQAWNEEDFMRLEQNLIAHLLMQKRLKRRFTIFIASTKNENEIISIDNQTGHVILENLIDNTSNFCSDNLSTFIDHLVPVA